MKHLLITLAAGAWSLAPLDAALVFEKSSPYHHVQVVDEAGVRMLSFNGTRETRMSLANPLFGHFEYTEYLHAPWIWNTNLNRVLMIGLGGGSTQRAYEHYYSNVVIQSVELDPVVVDVAKKYFHVKESPRHKIAIEDGRIFLRRATEKYDAIIMDAYTRTRYGSSIPPHLTTKEFFKIASDSLGTNGVLAYNVIGQVNGQNANIVGGIYRTMKEVFPQVYLFPATTTMNVVIVATKNPEPFDAARVQRQGQALVQSGTMRHPNFLSRLQNFRSNPPRAANVSPVLTDEHAPVEGLMREGGVIK